eukprot:CAMPEP_0201118870 /NCGR_PEP_ID=MMETSP0850-20130426/3065_1 /ASSEMBLY_ACC=CAM_ASM_000622 /TAXON_ID=183588 /ORGANISM="Pseudo-nitzschia fraudulenta, Strain WWA7" /LENGTH=344 /DNA_ID=CAMNT_0047384339 /DNA_START=328 /DNA_END=1362 /DNA_ORIENTATION=+
MTQLQMMAAAEEQPDSKLDKEDEEGVCKWEDEDGKKKCRDDEHRRKRDPYLPDSEGGRDYLDDDYYGGEYHEEYDEEQTEGGDDDDFYDPNDLDYERYMDRPEAGEEWDVWKHGGKGQIYTALKCPDYDYDNEEMFTNTSFENIHTTETWQTFNKVYNEVITATKGNEKLEQESSIPSSFEKHGFQFPIEIKFQPMVGRGVYTKEKIPKGRLLYISTNNGAFYEGQVFRNFLRALPPKLACDVMIWSFVRWVSLETETNEKHMVCVDLDEGSFVNSADVTDEYNMALGNNEGTLYHDGTDEEKEQLWWGCKMKFYASRDIEAGEEIRAEYGDFVETEGWKFLGL